MFGPRTWFGTVVVLSMAMAVTLPARADLMASYGHENAADRLQDDTGNGNTLTNVNAVGFVAAPIDSDFFYFEVGDTVAQFSGSEYLQVPDGVYADGSFTFTGLVNTAQSGAFQTILSSSRFRLQRAAYSSWNDGEPVLNMSVVTGGDNNDWVACDFEVGEWYFVALRYDQSTNELKSFIQGASGVWSPTTNDVTAPTGFNDLTNITLGRNVSSVGGPDNWNGMIDSARFYSTALSNAELKSVFFEFSVPEPSSIGLLAVCLCSLLLRRRR